MASRGRSGGGKMPWLIGGGLLGLLLWPKILAGLTWLGGMLMTALTFAAFAAVGVAALAATYHFLALPLIERWLDNREAEKFRQANRSRQQRPGPGLPRPAFAPPAPRPGQPAIPPTPPAGGTEGDPPTSGGQPANGQRKRRRPSPRPRSERNPEWAGEHEGNQRAG